MRLAARDRDPVSETLLRYPLGQALEVFGNDVLGVDMPPRPEPPATRFRHRYRPPPAQA